MPDDEETRWKARYERVKEAHQEHASALARLEARVEAIERVLAAKTDDVAKMDRAAAKADREATRKRRFQERVAASIAVRALRDKP
jgi:ferric-dicitrate binding protein FerR (iron transport regulator)